MAFYNIKSARGWGGGLWGGGPGRGKRTTLALYAGFCANGVWCALRPSAFVTASVPNFFLTLPFPAENGGVNLELDTHWPECFQSKFTPAPTPWCPNRAIVWPIGPKLGQRWCQARTKWNAFGATAPSAPNPFGFSFACGPKWADFIKVFRFFRRTPAPPPLIILNKRRCG